MSLLSLFGGGAARVSGEEAQGMVEEGAVLLDVRTPSEFDSGHLKGARNIPVHALQSRVGELDRNKAVVVYCRSGARSASAVRILKGAGFEKAVDLGPMTAWSSKAGAGPELGALAIPLMLSLTLGLAPLTPEPHIVGKIRWVAGGAVGMGAMDWFDIVMHGAPLVWFAVTLVRVVLARFGSAPQPRQKGSAS